MLISKFPNRGSLFGRIPTLMFKKMSHILAHVISEQINMSLMGGVFPTCLKTGRVTPIFKSGKNSRQLTIDLSLLYLSKLKTLKSYHIKE